MAGGNAGGVVGTVRTMGGRRSSIGQKNVKDVEMLGDWK
jgi:hypothetical protein